MCKEVEDYAKSYAMDYVKRERLDAIQRMIKKDYSKEAIMELGYSEQEYEKAEYDMLVQTWKEQDSIYLKDYLSYGNNPFFIVYLSLSDLR